MGPVGGLATKRVIGSLQWPMTLAFDSSRIQPLIYASHTSGSRRPSFQTSIR